MRTVLSLEPLASCKELGLNATLDTKVACPDSVCRRVREAMFHTHTFQSRPPLAK